MTTLKGNNLYIPACANISNFYISNLGFLCSGYPFIRVLSDQPIVPSPEVQTATIEGLVFRNGGWAVHLQLRFVSREARTIYAKKFKDGRSIN